MVQVFAATLFIGSLLLFFVQPMVGKMILPALGGSPSVWNTCMVFFQAALLAGYAYAHASVAWLGVRRQAALHILLLALPLLLLPISMSAYADPPASDNPVLWLLARLFLQVGLPFFVVSSTAPLLQCWFANTGHAAAKDPYFLYAASNAGSLLALLAYPVLVEPNLQLTHQSWVWAGGYLALIVMIVACAVLVRRSPAGQTATPHDPLADPAHAAHTDPRPAPNFVRRLHWIALAFVPSSLMLGVTTHATTNLAPVPLLWIIPLAIYLLTFVLVFDRSPRIPHAWMVRALPFIILPVGLTLFYEDKFGNNAWVLIPVHLTAFFVAAMVCHGQLVNTRPAAKHLTEFYLWLSVGGVLGGVFNALAAPLVFNRLIEYPLVMVLACLLCPRLRKSSAKTLARILDLALPAALALLVIGVHLGLEQTGFAKGLIRFGYIFALPVIVCLIFMTRPIRFGLGFAVLLLFHGYHAGLEKGNVLYITRNFFGVKKVTAAEIDGVGRFHILTHGSIYHGAQNLDPDKNRTPLTYYHPTGPAGDIFDAFNHSAAKRQVGLIGLGTGAMATYAKPAQQFTFFEIDPAVARIARDSQFFTFLADCRGQYDIVLGDGRLALARQADKQYGLIVIDAFSSDAIPTHLLSREAIKLYLSKLADPGLLAFHISNRYLDLEPLLANLAKQEGLLALARNESAVPLKEKITGKLASHYFVMARRRSDLATLNLKPEWKQPQTNPNIGAWTDQYCSVLTLLRTSSQASSQSAAKRQE